MLVLVALSLAPLARAEVPATSKFAEYMDAAVAVDHFSGSVLVAKGGETLFSGGFGLANAEHQVANTPRTKFRLGSITKQFTAMAILILRDQGKLSLDDPIGKYIDDAPKAWEGVTIHHLLTHTSGVHSYTSDPIYALKMTQPETVKSMIARFKDKPLDFKPGEKFSYSNSGYFLLGAVIEKVSGDSYEAFLKRAIFDPLDLKDTGYDHPRTVLSLRASGYERGAKGVENARYLDMMQPYAAGSLYSTVEDLSRWDRALVASKLISKDSYVRMFTPARSHYAYGWVVEEHNGRKEVSHGGGINGFATQILRYPEQEVCVVVLSNVVPSNPAKVARGLAAVALGEPYDLPAERKVAKVDPKVFDAYAGRYRLTPELVLTVTRDGDRLMAEPTGQPKHELFPESEAAFFLKVADVRVTFVKDGDKVTHAIVRQNGRDQKAIRIESDEKDAAPRDHDR
jgi:CubicO group peptidase (beta-lactamase class C family)